MLIPQNGDGPVIRDRSPDPVRTDAGFGPDGPGPQSKFMEVPVIPRDAAAFQRNPFMVTQDQAATALANCREQPIEFDRSICNQALRSITGLLELMLSNTDRRSHLFGRESVHGDTSPP